MPREQGTPVKIRDGPAAVICQRLARVGIRSPSDEVPLPLGEKAKRFESAVSQKTYQEQDDIGAFLGWGNR